MKRGPTITGLLLAAALGWGAVPAGAEPVLDLAQGSAPAAVTDEAGTLHVVWRDVSVFSQPLRYCRVAAVAPACTPVDISSHVGSDPQLVLRPQDGALIAMYVTDSDDAALDDATMAVVSLDGGTTWSAPTPIGFEDIENIDRAAPSADGGAVDTVASLGDRVLFQRVPLGGGAERRTVELGPREDVLVPRVTHLPDGRPLVIAHYADDRLGTRVPALGADPSDPNAWGSFRQWRTLRDADASAADSGPTGTWLLATVIHRRTPSGGLPVRIWRWGSRGFEDPRTIGALNRAAGQDVGESPGTNDLALDVDLAGRLHAAWGVAPRACRGQHCIVYRRTDRRGFGPPIVYPIGTAPGDVQRRFGIAANGGGSGWIVWGTHSNRIRAVALVTPPLGSRVGSRRIGRRRVTIPDFYGCVPSGGTFVHSVRVDGRRGAQILSVRFFFDAGQPARTDRRAPYSLRFRLTFPPGSRHVAGAVVRYRVPGRKGVRSVRLGRTFVMC